LGLLTLSKTKQMVDKKCKPFYEKIVILLLQCCCL